MENLKMFKVEYGEEDYIAATSEENAINGFLSYIDNESIQEGYEVVELTNEEMEEHQIHDEDWNKLISLSMLLQESQEEFNNSNDKSNYFKLIVSSVY